MRCVNDDTGACCGKCKNVVAVIPVHGRLPLLKLTISRLLNKNNVGLVVCVGETKEEEEACKQSGAIFVKHPNKPLGAKWNAGFLEAKRHSPAACLFVGSSDWVSDNWLPTLMPMMEKFDMVGTPGCSFLDVSKSGFKAMDWLGYIGERRIESIGIGRLLSKRILDRIGWRPFDNRLDNSLDSQMQKIVKKRMGRIAVVGKLPIKSLSISTDLWANKHKFDDHVSGRLPSKKIEDVTGFLQTYFPEGLELQKTLYAD